MYLFSSSLHSHLYCKCLAIYCIKPTFVAVMVAVVGVGFRQFADYVRVQMGLINQWSSNNVGALYIPSVAFMAQPEGSLMGGCVAFCCKEWTVYCS